MISTNPPKPKLALAVGVIGHRPNRIPEAARSRVESDVWEVLAKVSGATHAAQEIYSEFFSPTEPLFSIVSALAEGADRVAAEVALARGWALDATLPFSIEEYRADFETFDSTSKFDSLLHQSRTILELPGNRANEAQAYESVGLTVLDQSDILLAIWDHGPSAGGGGTTQMLQAAVQLDLPIVHVDAKGRTPPRILWSQISAFPVRADSIEDLPSIDLDDGLRSLIERIILPPTAPSERQALRRYLTERFFQFNFRLEFPLLTACCGVRAIKTTDWRPLAPRTLADGLLEFSRRSSHEGKAAGPVALAFAYGWADATGSRFAQVFRSAFVINFVFAAFTVVVAAMSALFDHDNKVFFVIVELLLIGVVLLNTVVGRFRAWHRRWFEPREIAERLRTALPMWMLGARPTSFSGHEPAWTGWYARAICREQCIRAGSLDEHGLAAAREVLLSLIEDQRSYHRTTAARMALLERRLERFGVILFGATALTAATFLIVSGFLGVAQTLALPVTALATGLPAVATG